MAWPVALIVDPGEKAEDCVAVTVQRTVRGNCDKRCIGDRSNPKMATRCHSCGGEAWLLEGQLHCHAEPRCYVCRMCLRHVRDGDEHFPDCAACERESGLPICSSCNAGRYACYVCEPELYGWKFH